MIRRNHNVAGQNRPQPGHSSRRAQEVPVVIRRSQSSPSSLSPETTTHRSKTHEEATKILHRPVPQQPSTTSTIGSIRKSISTELPGQVTTFPRTLPSPMVFLPELDEDTHIAKHGSVSGPVVQFIKKLTEEKNLLKNGNYVETETSGGANAQPDLTHLKETTENFTDLEKLLPSDQFLSKSTVKLLKENGITDQQIANCLEAIKLFISETYPALQRFQESSKERTIGATRDLKMATLDKTHSSMRKLERTIQSLLPRSIPQQKIIDEALLRISTQSQSQDWFPEEPGGIAGNALNEWTAVFRDLMGKYLSEKGMMEDPETDILMFNSGDTPLDIYSETDGFFAITSGQYEGMIFGIDYSTDPDKKLQRRLGRRFYINNETASFLAEELAHTLNFEGLQGLLSSVPPLGTKNYNEFKKNLNPRDQEKFKKLLAILAEFRNKLYREVMKPAFDEYVKGIEEDIPSIIENVNQKRIETRYINDISELVDLAEAKRDD